MFKWQITLSRRDRRPLLNICFLSDPPCFSFPTSFKSQKMCYFDDEQYSALVLVISHSITSASLLSMLYIWTSEGIQNSC
jgi:hypothetical protein